MMIPLRENYAMSSRIGEVESDTYQETENAEITSRLLGDLSRETYVEYVGYGTIIFKGERINVKAVYIIAKDDLTDADGDPVDLCNLDWTPARFQLN